MPLKFNGNGNCLSRSASLSFYNDQSRHIDLGLRTAAEQCKNSRHYAEATVHRACSCTNSTPATVLLSSTLQRSTSNVFSRALESCVSLEDAYFQAAKEEIKSTCNSGWYSSVLKILGLYTAVGTTINLIYLMCNKGIRSFLHTKVNLMGTENDSRYSIKMMWSTTQRMPPVLGLNQTTLCPCFLVYLNLRFQLVNSIVLKTSSQQQTSSHFGARFKSFSSLQLIIYAFQKYRPELYVRYKRHQQSNLINLTITHQNFSFHSQVNYHTKTFLRRY